MKMQQQEEENQGPGPSKKTGKQLDLLTSQFIGNPRWNLSSRKYSVQELQAIFKTLSNPKQLNYLWLHWNGIEKICKMVVQPIYSQLKIMNIGGNNILSVQLLCHAKMESLEELWLWSNYITKVDCLRKMYIPNLKYLDLSSNFISEWPKFHELHSHHLQLISIQRNNLTQIDHFVKNIDLSLNCAINIFQNKLVKLFGQTINKKKRKGRLYSFLKKKLEYA